jgi:GT2 family glycosyltransferase
MYPRVSVLIVNYRSYEPLRRCLSAIERYANDAEVVVVDYATNAGAVAALRGEFPRVSIDATDGNEGFAAGINRAARQARGGYLLVLNPDTELTAGTLERLADWLDQHPGTAVAAPLVRAGNGAIEASARAFPGWSTVLGGRRTFLSRVWPGNPFTRRNLLTGPHVRDPMDVDWVTGACMLLRRSAFESVGGFDEGFFLYWEDADLCRRLRMAGWTVTYLPAGEIRHTGGQSSRHAPDAASRAFHRSVYRYFLKHGGRWRYALAPLVFVAVEVRRGIGLAAARSDR